MHTITSILPWVFLVLVLIIGFEVLVTQLLGKNRGFIRIKRRKPDTEANPVSQTGETPTSETQTSQSPSRFQFSLKYEFRPMQLRSFWWALPLDLALVVLSLFGLVLELFMVVVFGLMELLMLLIELVFGLIELALEMMIPLAIAGFVIFTIIQLLRG